MKYLAIVQARCGSTRLPNKVLADLNGQPVLAHVVDRLHRSQLLDEVMVATSIGKENLPIVELCAQKGVRVYVGPEEDVLARYALAAMLLKPQMVVRITADCPLHDGLLVDEAIQAMKPATDYLWMESRTFPNGLDLEIMTMEALLKAYREATLLSEREHVTQYIRKNPQLFNIQDFAYQRGDYSHMRFTIDEPEDYTLVQKIVKAFGHSSYGYNDVVDLLLANPQWMAINAMHHWDAGLHKSLANDGVAQRDKFMGGEMG